MSPVFADTAYFIALLNPVDQYHSRAVELARQPCGPMVTTTWVLVEVGDAFSQPRNRTKYARLVALLQSTPGMFCIRGRIFRNYLTQCESLFRRATYSLECILSG